MKFLIFKINDDNYLKEIEIPTLEALIKLKEKCNDDIIITSSCEENLRLAIIVGDSFNEDYCNF